jgi:hypothetical protein
MPAATFLPCEGRVSTCFTLLETAFLLWWATGGLPHMVAGLAAWEERTRRAQRQDCAEPPFLRRTCDGELGIGAGDNQAARSLLAKS